MPIAATHSGLSEPQRRAAWWTAREGLAPIVIGTRSAVWSELCRPGVIVVDEEHDLSYKQQGFRYSARDIAIIRAKRHRCPVVLGSATPLPRVAAQRRDRPLPASAPAPSARWL